MDGGTGTAGMTIAVPVFEGEWCRFYFNWVSVSELPSTVMLTGLSIYILCVVRHAAYPKLIQFNARNVYKICIVQTPRVLQWSCTAILQQESRVIREQRRQTAE